MSNKIQIKRGRKTDLPQLSAGELGFAVDTDEVFIGNGEENANIPLGAKGDKGNNGTNGVTYTPHVSSNGTLSWTNDGGLENPANISIKGEKGDKGDRGADAAITQGCIERIHLSPDVTDGFDYTQTMMETFLDSVYGLQYNNAVDNRQSLRSKGFQLDFICKGVSYKSGYSSGTWECSDLNSLYENILFKHLPLKHHSYTDICKISVYDSYIENDYYEILISINLDSNNADGFPVGSLMGSDNVEIYNTYLVPKYPYISHADDTRIDIVLGYICLSETGEDATLIVPAADLTNELRIVSSRSKLKTTNKSTIIGAINELCSRVSVLEAQQ